MNLDGLNKEQRLAAETLEGPVLILAGAGSGKTRALTYRVANLIDHGVAPWHILAITFTNKAAKEMKERVSALTGEKGEEVWVSTFHSMCARILRRDIDKLGYTRSFTIYDEDDQSAVLKEQLKHFNIDDKMLSVRELKGKISDAKNKLLSPDEWFRQSEKDFRCQQIHDIYDGYEKRLKASNALDFDDLLVRTLELFADHPPVLESYRERFRYVHVDEYQDTNFAQYTLVKLITKNSRNLCVVGDDDQSIYGWRGADIRNILDFQKDFPDAKVIKLEQNYRSTANILDAANQVIAHNAGRMEKALWTELPAGEPIKLFAAGDEREEAAWVCDRIAQQHRRHREYSDMAVLYRAHYITRGVEEVLLKEKIPYTIYSGVQFFARAEIKDALSYLRMIACRDDLSFLRIANVPRRNLGERRMTFLKDYAAQNGCSLYDALRKNLDGELLRGTKAGKFVSLIERFTGVYDQMPVSELLAAVLNESGYETMLRTEGSQIRLDNLAELKQSIYAYETTCGEECTLEHYLAHVAMFTSADLDDPRDQVRLMTVHSAKGLEFPHVFLVGLEEGLFPGTRSLGDPEEMEEERRLCYVAITRAKQSLTICYARTRMLYGRTTTNIASRFVDELPPECVNRTEQPKPKYDQPRDYGSFGRVSIYGDYESFSPRPAGQSAPRRSYSSVVPETKKKAPAVQFSKGEMVQHKAFGRGMVLSVIPMGGDALLEIAFDGVGTKKLMANTASQHMTKL